MMRRYINVILLILLQKSISLVLKLPFLYSKQKAFLEKQIELRKQALVQQEVERRLSDFLSITSHEFKTPLTSIKGNIQLANRKLRNSTVIENFRPYEALRILIEVRTILERTDQQITHLTQLLNSIIESTRINNKILDLLYELCELDSLLRTTIQEEHNTSPKQVIQLIIEQETPILIKADVQRIKQVILHYLSNARKFSPRDTPIEIRLREEGQTACVTVHDQGQGIPESDQKHIWERYYHVPDNKVLNGSEIGLGLGLYICRTIIEQHQGQVGVQSAVGKGSTFWFTLPLASSSNRSET